MPDPQSITLQPITLITGASAGIGAALADEFARHGHALVLVARREPQLQAVADAVERRGHPRPRVMTADLAAPGAADRIDAQLRAAGLEVQFLVNNAGFGLVGPATSLDRGEQLAIVDLNARALTELSLCFVDSMARHKGGILNVASLAGFMPGPGMAVYHATKAYVLSFSEALHQELKARDVRVTALCPGPVETEFQARAGMPSDYFPPMFARSAERVAREGYGGLMANRRVVVPGSHNRVAALLPRLLPRGLMLSIMSRYRQSRTR
jgi:short-subunit dehydrogenase